MSAGLETQDEGWAHPQLHSSTLFSRSSQTVGDRKSLPKPSDLAFWCSCWNSKTLSCSAALSLSILQTCTAAAGEIARGLQINFAVLCRAYGLAQAGLLLAERQSTCELSSVSSESSAAVSNCTSTAAEWFALGAQAWIATPKLASWEVSNLLRKVDRPLAASGCCMQKKYCDPLQSTRSPKAWPQDLPQSKGNRWTCRDTQFTCHAQAFGACVKKP